MVNDLALFDGQFWYTETNLSMLLNYPLRINGGLVLFCTEGEALVSIGIQKNRLVRNTELIVLPGTTFYLLSASHNFHARMFTFSKEISDEASARLGTPFYSYLLETPGYTYPNDSEYLNNISVWMDMAELIYNDKRNTLNPLMQRNFLQNYLYWLYDKSLLYFEETIGRYTRKQERYNQFLSLLDTYCREQRDASFYADKLCITLSYLRMICRECDPYESPKEIIDKRVILEIKVLLQSTDHTIQEISQMLHFPDQSYMGRYFKRHTGLSATEYRNRQREHFS